MARADAAGLIASSLGDIPLPDGRSYRFMSYSSFGQAEDTKSRIANLAKEVGEGIVHLLETNGFTIGHQSDPVIEPASGKRIATLRCPTCGKGIAQLPLSEHDWLTPTSLEFLGQLKLECPHA